MSFIRRIKKKDGQVYLAEVESKWINGKSVQKHIRYIGKEINGEVVLSLSSKDLQVDGVKVYGPLLLFHSISKKIKLPEILGKYSDEILSMIYAHCMDYRSVRNMPKWYERTDLNLLLDLGNLTEARLVKAMDSINDDQIEIYQRSIFSNVKKMYRLDSKGIVYDLTNTYFHGKHCVMGKVERSKDGRRQNDLIQIALATTQKDGIPVFHKTFDGNIHDSKTLADVSNNFSQHSLQSGLLIYDRGIVSEKNIDFIGDLGWHTLCGLPMREKEKAIIRRTIKNDSINNISNMVTIGESIFYVKGIPHSFGSIKGKLVICYNESKKTEITESRRKRILNAQELINKNKKIEEGLRKHLTPRGRIRTDVLKKDEELDGYSCIFSTKKISDKEMVRLYFDKEIIERAFKTLKGISNVRPIRFWLNKRVKSHVFICYLSYLILSILKLSLKSKGINMSPEKAIENLETMYNVYLSDNRKKHKFTRTVTLNKTQEQILKSVDPKILKNHIMLS